MGGLFEKKKKTGGGGGGELRHKDKCTWCAAVIWSEYKADERKRMRVQFAHLHTVFAIGKRLTGLQWVSKRATEPECCRADTAP